MTDFLTKINQIDCNLRNKEIHEQVSEVNVIVNAVSGKEVLSKAPKSLGLLPDKYAEIMLTLEPSKVTELSIMNNLLNNLRQFLSLKFGVWSLPNLKTARFLKENYNLNSCLEVMAGNAYWTRALNEVGLEAVATDSFEWAKTSKTGGQTFCSVETLSATKAIRKYSNTDLILCSWAPNFTKSDVELVKVWRKYSPRSHLIFIGEKMGATNSKEFWQREKFVNSKKLVQINQSFRSYDFIDEKLYEIKNEI